jgi:DNA-binding transcriptional MerR regulator
MSTTLTIGDFSRMTRLSVKTLRHYHQVGLLEPAEVDPYSNYRRYTLDQVATAQIIRRFRDLDMPVDQVRAVLSAPDLATRNALIAQHLDRLEDRLAQTQHAVSSLRNLLTTPKTEIPVLHRSMPEIPAMAVTAQLDRGELVAWWQESLTGLTAVIAADGLRRTGPFAALFANELFEHEAGEATVYCPVEQPGPVRGQVRPFTVPAAELVIARHDGVHSDVDITYAELGTYVAEHELAIAGPVRETYLVGYLDTTDQTQWQTEIGWPTFRLGADTTT